MRDSGAAIARNLPQIMGLDCAGVVEEADAGETSLAPGQPVVLPSTSYRESSAIRKVRCLFDSCARGRAGRTP